ncbi:SRPBCC family protein [Metabacillus arenae]|uniref:SRPBCC family protein n=1 Tax=Metabacillus arenae TaxID=2771434 RepID=A0A926NDZ9_9BACI|nr:SRPBCC family protein [Metabacillus arenae]MBD1379749.1 SRPBCC family protein [Metabacillus arenae]
MPVVKTELFILSCPEICFDLARDIDVHQQSTRKTNEKAISGRTSGLIELNEQVTWEAVHFGIRQQLTAKITEFDRPHRFVDEMVEGAFKSFFHVHEFIPKENGTLMIDTFTYKSPFGILGSFADFLFLKAYMEKFLTERNLYVKKLAEERFAGFY